jgi:hypothetical protein
VPVICQATQQRLDSTSLQCKHGAALALASCAVEAFSIAPPHPLLLCCFHGALVWHRPQVELAPIQLKLPEEMMLFVFSRLGPYMVGRAACVCQQWRTYAEVGPSRAQQAVGSPRSTATCTLRHAHVTHIHAVPLHYITLHTRSTLALTAYNPTKQLTCTA